MDVLQNTTDIMILTTQIQVIMSNIQSVSYIGFPSRLRNPY